VKRNWPTLAWRRSTFSIRKTSISNSSACKLRAAAVAAEAAAVAVEAAVEVAVEAAAVEVAVAEAVVAAVAAAACPGELAAGARLEHYPLTDTTGHGRVMVSTRPISCVIPRAAA
jgi:hypothetical protein